MATLTLTTNCAKKQKVQVSNSIQTCNKQEWNLCCVKSGHINSIYCDMYIALPANNNNNLYKEQPRNDTVHQRSCPCYGEVRCRHPDAWVVSLMWCITTGLFLICVVVVVVGW